MEDLKPDEIRNLTADEVIVYAMGNFSRIAQCISVELTRPEPRKTVITELVDDRLKNHKNGWHYPDFLGDRKSKNNVTRYRFATSDMKLLLSLTTDDSVREMIARGWKHGKTSSKWRYDTNNEEFLEKMENAFVQAALSTTDEKTTKRMLGCAGMTRTARETAEHNVKEIQSTAGEDLDVLAKELMRELKQASA
jgi:hypothetical protein